MRASLIFSLIAALYVGDATAAAPQIYRHLFVLPDDNRVVGERGRLRVPETAKPGARQIEIAFARIRSTAKNPGPPIFWLEGGPGASSIAAFREKPAMIAMLREFGDVIAVDQRGAGESPELLDCPQRWALPLDRPIERGNVAAETRRIFAECRAQWSAQGVDLDGYNSAAYADDILRVADALGYHKVRLHAFSFGTHIALVAVARHPARIERATLFGTIGLDNSLRDPAALDAVLERVSAMLAASPAGKAYPPLEQLATRAIRAVAAQPIALHDAKDETGRALPVVLDASALKSFIVDTLGSRREVVGLPRFLAIVAKGADVAGADATATSLIDDMTWTRRGPAHRRAALQHYATVCASGISAEARKALIEKRESTILGQTQHAGLPEACDALNVADVGTALRAVRPAPVPLLLVSGSIDTKTPLEQAQAVASAHRGAVLVTVEGAGHGDLVARPEVEPLVRAFLGGRTPNAQTISLPPLEFTPPS